MSIPREVELKLEIAPHQAGALRGLLPARPRRRTLQVSTYYDTAKGAVRKAGFSLRVRESNGKYVQTIKGEGGAAGLFDRPEWETRIEGGEPDFDAIDATPLGAILTKRLRARLEKVSVSTVDRTLWLLDRQGSRIEIVLDEGTIRAGGRECPLCELEIELKRGESAALLDFARTLGEALPLRIGVLSKAERGFALAAGDDKAAKSVPLVLAGEMTAARGFAAIVQACLRHFRLNEPLIVQRRDSAALHQARVAMRRLRSALSLFGRTVHDESFPALRAELRWFTDRLGEARNLDVFLAGAGDAPDLEAQRGALEAARERAYTDAIEAMDSQRFRALMLDLLVWAETGDWSRSDKACAPLAAFAARRLDRQWAKVRDRGVRMETLDESRRHRLRIDIKKLRYALEFMASLHCPRAGDARRFTNALEAMQEVLGHLNDMATASALMERFAEGPAPAPPAPDRAAERKLLAKARKHFARLIEIGPYWQELDD